MLDLWITSCLDGGGRLNSDLSHLDQYITLEEELKSKTKVSKSILKIVRSELQKNILECLIIADDCSDEDIAEYTGIDMEVIDLYRYSVFMSDYAFDSKIDKLDYIETGIEYGNSISGAHGESILNGFLLKRWATLLGSDFVLWKFNLGKVEYNTADLYNSILKEAFFYHKEKSMGNTDITLPDYLKSTALLLNSVKTKDNIKANSDGEAVLDIGERLDIIISDETPPEKSFDDMGSEEFINNAILSDE